VTNIVERLQLLAYLTRKRDDAKLHGSALCESFDPWELEDIVAALSQYYEAARALEPKP
jgi:hypothetical protein